MNKSCHQFSHPRPKSLIEECWDSITSRCLMCPKLKYCQFDFMVCNYPIQPPSAITVQGRKLPMHTTISCPSFSSVQLLVEDYGHALQFCCVGTPSHVCVPQLGDVVYTSLVNRTCMKIHGVAFSLTYPVLSDFLPPVQLLLLEDRVQLNIQFTL